MFLMCFAFLELSVTGSTLCKIDLWQNWFSEKVERPFLKPSEVLVGKRVRDFGEHSLFILLFSALQMKIVF